MAHLDVLPEQHIIAGFKGTIDFYVHRGIPCARRWPRYHPRPPSPDELFNQDNFARLNQLASTLGQEVKEAWGLMVAGTSWTWKDAFVKAGIRGSLT